MESTDAYHFAISKVNELKKEGINIIIEPYDTKKYKSIVEKFKNQQNGIPSKLWSRVSFKGITSSQALKIINMGNYLGMCGISFDVGGCCSLRNWEFDWSFRYKSGDENSDWREAYEDVEEKINELSSEEQVDYCVN